VLHAKTSTFSLRQVMSRARACSGIPLPCLKHLDGSSPKGISSKSPFGIGQRISTLNGSFFSFFCSFRSDFLKRGSSSIRLESRVLATVFPSSIADCSERETEFWSLFACRKHLRAASMSSCRVVIVLLSARYFNFKWAVEHAAPRCASPVLPMMQL